MAGRSKWVDERTGTFLAWLLVRSFPLFRWELLRGGPGAVAFGRCSGTFRLVAAAGVA